MHISIAQDSSKHSDVLKNNSTANLSELTKLTMKQQNENQIAQQRYQQSNTMLQQNAVKNLIKNSPNNNLTQQNLLATAIQLQQKEMLQQQRSNASQTNSTKFLQQQQFRTTNANLMPNRNVLSMQQNLNQKPTNLSHITPEQALLTQQLLNPLFFQE